MVERDEFLQLLTAGASAGLMVLVLILRLNPGVTTGVGEVLLAMVVWALWGALLTAAVGVLCLGAARMLRGRRRKLWMLPWLAIVIFLVGAVLSRVNADINEAFLTGSAHRILGQDAMVWLGVVLVVVAADRVGARRRARWRVWVVVAVILVVPVVRLAWVTAGPANVPLLSRKSLGHPRQGLVVVGVEGLDINLFLASTTGGRYPALDRFVRGGSWGPLRPYRPFLKRSLWTTVAVGAYPREHGVKGHSAWELPGILDGPLLLLPTTGIGGSWLIPRPLVRKVPPPPSTLPPLWSRLVGGGMPVRVAGWPGVWSGEPAGSQAPAPGGSWSAVEVNLRHALDLALARFPEAGEAVRHAVVSDMAKVAAVESGGPQWPEIVWVELESLAVARSYLEPEDAGDTDERAVQGLVLELLDEKLDELLQARPGGLVVLVSPYGMARPDPVERILRTLGGGRRWRTSARSCPPGLVAFLGPGVVRGNRMESAQLVDVAPTICYLLGLPVPQYMEGRVILGAIDPDYLSANSLQVVE